MLNATKTAHGVVRFDYVKDKKSSTVVPKTAAAVAATNHPISTGPAPKTAAEIEAEAAQLAKDVAEANAAK